MPQLTSDKTRFGGELPNDCDPLLPDCAPAPALYFSHGRSALDWFIKSNGFRSALACAYTCPAVPHLLKKLQLPYRLYDHGDDTLTRLLVGMEGPALVILPLPFGGTPWIDASDLNAEIIQHHPENAVLIDGAQTAFAHQDYPVPADGAVLSCPRKTTSLADGAVLSTSRPTTEQVAQVDQLADCPVPSSLKLAARALFGTGLPKWESIALELNKEAEQEWPDGQFRMSDRSRYELRRIDSQAHAAKRRENFRQLHDALQRHVEIVPVEDGTPYCLPVLTNERSQVLKRLHAARVFASPLWHDSECDKSAHPVASNFTQRLVSLPVDQRYTSEDMEHLAIIVKKCLK